MDRRPHHGNTSGLACEPLNVARRSVCRKKKSRISPTASSPTAILDDRRARRHPARGVARHVAADPGTRFGVVSKAFFVAARCGSPHGRTHVVALRVARYGETVTIIDWNGADLPAELRGLPAGKYVIQRADDAFTPDEEQGLITALESLHAGKGVPHDAARERLLQRARR